MKTNDKLVYDIGMHDGSDTEFYLKKGFNVIAVDANPKLIENAKIKFSKFIQSKQLRLVNLAISDQEGQTSFYLSKHDIWSSLNPDISSREGLLQEAITVQAKKITTLFEEFGVPAYCKIDIEGYDAVCLETMKGAKQVPKFISVETESIAEETDSIEAPLRTLNLLFSLGYSRFKLVDQSNLAPLLPDEIFYSSSWFNRGLNLVHRKLKLGSRRNYRQLLSIKLNHPFKYGCSGPFGEDVPGCWYEYEVAKDMLLKHRKEYHNRKDAKTHGFWCDWHAKLF